MIIGIDFGSTLTKIVLMDEFNILETESIENGKSYTDIIRKFDLANVSKIMITGAGASYIDEDIENIPTEHVDEFKAAAVGSYRLAGVDECLVVSLGTGTSFTYVNRERIEHTGGSGIGGALLSALGNISLGINDNRELLKLAAGGKLENSDLLIQDISKGDIDNLTGKVTVANMAKLTKTSEPADLAFGSCYMVFQNVGVMAVLAARPFGTKNIVVMGTLAQNDLARDTFNGVGNLFGYKFIIPENVKYGVAIGAALNGLDKFMNAFSVYEKDNDDVTYQFE